jgi:ABC-type bacteriocin/lantibiotic exporter with double-glycine peptidase domain
MRTALKSIWKVLTRQERQTFLLLTFLTFLTATVEALSLTLVFPALSVILQQEDSGSQQAELLGSLLEGFPNLQLKALFGMSLLLLAFILKNGLQSVSKFMQFRFQGHLESRLTTSIYSNVINQEFSFFSKANSGELTRKILDVTQVIEHGIAPFLLLLSEFLVLVGIAVILVSVEPLGFLVVVAFFAFTSGMYLAWSNSVTQSLGEERRVSAGERIRLLQFSFLGVREIKVFSREDELVERFSSISQSNSRSSSRFLFIKFLPTYFLEILVVAGLGALATILAGSKKSTPEIIATLALFAVAAFRVLPSSNRVLSALQSLRYGSSTVCDLVTDLTLKPHRQTSDPNSRLEFRRVVKFSCVTYSYGATDRPAISNVDLELKAGYSYGIVGQSGSGKSTFLDLLLGLLVPSSGSISVDGVDLREVGQSWRRVIGYVPQSVFLFEGSLADNIAFGVPSEEVDMERVKFAYEFAVLGDFVSGLPNGVLSHIGDHGAQMSGGERQRVGIARALYSNPQVLVLDEATSALDSDTERKVLESIRRYSEGLTLFSVTHRTAVESEFDELLVVSEGTVSLKSLI